jgi:hypothetical protein
MGGEQVFPLEVIECRDYLAGGQVAAGAKNHHNTFRWQVMGLIGHIVFYLLP